MPQATLPVLVPPRVFVDISSYQRPSDVLEQSFTSLIPLERVTVFFDDARGVELPEELFLMMPNIETLNLFYPKLYKGFLQSDPYGWHDNTNPLPSFRLLRLKEVPPLDDCWDDLAAFLDHRASENQTISLGVIGGFPPLRP